MFHFTMEIIHHRSIMLIESCYVSVGTVLRHMPIQHTDILLTLQTVQ